VGYRPGARLPFQGPPQGCRLVVTHNKREPALPVEFAQHDRLLVRPGEHDPLDLNGDLGRAAGDLIDVAPRRGIRYPQTALGAWLTVVAFCILHLSARAILVHDGRAAALLAKAVRSGRRKLAGKRPPPRRDP